MLRPAAALLLAAAATAAETAPRPPNLLLLIADDMGYADAGFQGSKDIRTTNLDRLAAGGARLTTGYVVGAVCSPSRAGLFSGRWPQRFGHERNPQEDAADVGLDPGERSLAERLGERGYATALVGKWHLGFGQPFHPRTRGFTAFWGFSSGGHDYFLTDPQQALWSYRGLLDEEGGPARLKADTNLTDHLGQRAADWLRRPRDGRPFFLAVCFNAPHTPMQADDRRLKACSHIEDPKRRTYAAMMLAMDEAVGAIDQALTDSGEAGRTLTVFLSDNGGATTNASSNAPLRGAKGTFYEGGVRVPMLWRLPGVLPAGAVRHQPVISLDIAATMAAQAGPSQGPPPDGSDVLPALAADTRLPERPIYWRRDGKGALRLGDWKLVHDEQGQQLYNLASDPAEAKDLAQAEAPRLAALRATWDAWSAQMRPPAFPGLVVPDKPARKP